MSPRSNQSGPDEAIPPVRDLEGGPDNPLEIPPAGWKNTFKRAVKKFSLDRCTMAAGSLAYHWFFALFPAVVAAIGVISLVHLGSSTLDHLISGLGKALPGGAASVFQTAITQAQHKSAGALTTVILGLALALWSSSGGMAALETALDVAYEVPKSAKFVKKRLKAFVLILCTVVFGGLSSVFIVEGAPLGNGLSNLIGVHGLGFTVIWTIVRWVLTIILVSLLFSCYYFFGPNREMPTWRWVSPGGVVGTIIFLAASLGFSFYVSEFGNSSYSKTYGSLAGVALLIFWLYLAGIAVLVGGEINAESERQAAAQAGHPGARQSARQVEEGSAQPSGNTAPK
ncbi:MAG TPA: YihY/virulence factor BrkB family protein [Streptosporangiaceae bacterium]|nr:YihY/virulence factor BrkB family protein [Streptosporangiaceae bacterium]